MLATETATIERLLVRAVLSGYALNATVAPMPDIRTEQWFPLLKSAEEHGLAPLLYASLKKRDALQSMPPEQAKALRESYLRTYIANWLAYKELRLLLEICERERIPVIVLKGAALGTTLYPEPALRPFSDLDLLFRRRDVERVSALLAGQGYEPAITNEDCYDFEQSQEFTRHGKRAGTVEVHWHLLDATYYHARIPIEWFGSAALNSRSRTRARGG